MKPGETYFLDTNALLEATDVSRSNHGEALGLFDAAIEAGAHLALSGQILREYLVVATRPVEANGLGLAAALALENAERIAERSVFLEETRSVSEALRRLVAALAIGGKRIHDANVVATMQRSRLQRLVTLNRDDFADFQGLVVLTPGEAIRE